MRRLGDARRAEALRVGDDASRDADGRVRGGPVERLREDPRVIVEEHACAQKWGFHAARPELRAGVGCDEPLIRCCVNSVDT